MTKNTKIKLGAVAGFGIVAGLGVVTALPAATHAAETADTTVQASITDSMSISATGSVTGTLTNGGSVVELKDGSSNTGKFNVVTNKATGYQVTAIAAGATGHENELYDSTTTKSIAYGTPVQGTSAWNITVNNVAVANLSTTAQQVYTQNTPTGTAGQDTPVKYQASAAGDQAAGTYNGKVTFTVSAN